MAKLPLEGIRVLDSTSVFSLPYTAALMADMGAEVIKVEGPGHPDATRMGGPFSAFPENIVSEDWWNRASTYVLLHRGKLSITLDLSSSKARDLFRELVGVSDVILENYSSRVMRGWGLDYEELRKVRPDIIMVSNTGYGHGEGPYSGHPAQATTLEGTHGLCWVTGYPGGPPSRAGAAHVDFLSTWTALFAIGAALHHRSRTGRGQWIDLGMYQVGVTCISEYVLDYAVNGRLGERTGNRHPFRAPQGCYRARGLDEWIALSVGSDEQWRALCELMGRPELAEDPRFDGVVGRSRHHDELDSILNQWTEHHGKYELMEVLQPVGISAGPVFDNRDTHLDPHFRARGFLESVTYPEDRGVGTRPFIGRPFKLSKGPVKVRGPAPAMGQHNWAVLGGLLGVSEEEYLALESRGLIGTVPTQGEPVFPSPIDDQLKQGRLAEWDPDYKARLGIP